jgi:hypothetical protein
MDGGILIFPLRAGVVGTRLVLRATGDVAGCALKLGGKAVVAATEATARAAGTVSDEVAWGRPAPPLEVPPVPAPGPGIAPEGPETPPLATEKIQSEPEPDRWPVPDPWPEPEPEPAHVSEEPELVEEIAEPGAEDGAGASIEIAEPWPGYRGLTAAEVIARIDDATPAELAGIELYESVHRNRQTVLAAAQRSLKTKTGRGSPDRRE